MFPSPIISGLLRPSKIGLASKGMTHGMTKLLCLSVRLGLYPTDICWLRLIQALEKPGIRVRHRWLFPLQFCLEQDSSVCVCVGEGGFTDSLKYNYLYKNIRNQWVFTYCNSVCIFFFCTITCSLILFVCADPIYWWLKLDRDISCPLSESKEQCKNALCHLKLMSQSQQRGEV